MYVPVAMVSNFHQVASMKRSLAEDETLPTFILPSDLPPWPNRQFHVFVNFHGYRVHCSLSDVMQEALKEPFSWREYF